MHDKIDPNMVGGNLMINIEVKTDAGAQFRVTIIQANLNLRSTPDTDSEIIGKAAREEVVTLLEKTDDNWWKIRTEDGAEGYAFAEYLSPI